MTYVTCLNNTREWSYESLHNELEEIISKYGSKLCPL